MQEKLKNTYYIESLKNSISTKSKRLKPINLMEVCGTHTMAIAKYGLKELLPSNINLISGPGCPVCVTPNKDIDKMIALSKNPNVIITTFGDMMRVPGSSSSLLKEKANGADIRVVYSPLDSLNIAEKNREKEVVFLAVGFETTTPTTSAAIKRAVNLKLKNFSVFCVHKNMPNALSLLANDPKVQINGLILPGHVSTIIGINPYEFLANEYKIPGVISGFEAIDIMQAINMLVTQIANNEAKIENAYKRGVRENGNHIAFALIDEVFKTRDSEWRGLGSIKNSGYKLKKLYKDFDAESKFQIKAEPTKENKACRCGDVLKGIITPKKCPLFGKACNPENPIGPCMVSSEGSCSASYKY